MVLTRLAVRPLKTRVPQWCDVLIIVISIKIIENEQRQKLQNPHQIMQHQINVAMHRKFQNQLNDMIQYIDIDMMLYCILGPIYRHIYSFHFYSQVSITSKSFSVHVICHNSTSKLLVFITVYFVLLSAKEIRQIPKIIHKSKPTMQLAFLVC